MTHKDRIKTPTILQMEAAECGAAALAIIMAYHGRYVALEKLRMECGVSRDGSKAVNMLKVARSYGFTALGAKTEDPMALAELTLPVIVFWSFNHFVVVEAITKQHVYINDPATGPRVISYDEFDKNFTGVLLTFEPNKSFKPGGSPPSAVDAIKQRILGSEKALLFIIIASLALVIPGIIIPGFTKIFIDDILIAQRHSWMLPLFWGMIITAILRGLLTWLQQFFLLRLQIKLLLSNAAKFVWHTLKLPMTFFTQRYAGDIQERINANDRIADLLSGQLSISMVNVISMVFFAIVMLLLDWQLTLFVLLISGASAFLFYVVADMIANISRRFLQEQGKLRGIEMNGLQIIESLKASGAEDDFFKRWSGQHAKIINSQQNIMMYNQILIIAPQLLFGLTTIFILGFGGWQIMQGALTVGTLIAFQSITASFTAPLNGLLSLANQIQRIRGDLTRLDDVLKHPQDPRTTQPEKMPAEVIKKLQGGVQLNNISFGYSPVDPPIMSDINLTIEPGQQIAIVGATGSGKSTMARLLSGLYQPWTGEVCYDGIALNDIPQHLLAESVAFVDQDIFLFKGTVADNLSLWENTVSNDSMYQALKDACAYDVVAPRGGLVCDISEGGRNFSGGQQQRLEIARALVGNPSVLILDEATASLDPLIELQILNNLKQRHCTLIMITHRLSAIRDSDIIIVLQDGKIVQQGKHQQLIEQTGPYKQLIAWE